MTDKTWCRSPLPADGRTARMASTGNYKEDDTGEQKTFKLVKSFLQHSQMKNKENQDTITDVVCDTKFQKGERSH